METKPNPCKEDDNGENIEQGLEPTAPSPETTEILAGNAGTWDGCSIYCTQQKKSQQYKRTNMHVH